MIIKRYRKADEPDEDQNSLTPPGISELARDEIGEDPHHAEADDEGNDQRRRSETELF